MTKRKKVTLEELAEMLEHVVRHMATKDDLADGLASVRTEMATKDDLSKGLASVRAEMAEGFAALRAELRDMRQELSELREKVEEQSCYTKEIDMRSFAFPRLRNILD